MAGELVIENGELLLAQVTARIEAATAETLAAVNVVALLVETEAKKRCPVGTPESTGKPGYIGGRLRSSLHTTPASDVANIEATVGTDVEYGPFIEHGTSKMAAQPFLLPAFVLETAQLESMLADAINKALQG